MELDIYIFEKYALQIEVTLDTFSMIRHFMRGKGSYTYLLIL